MRLKSIKLAGFKSFVDPTKVPLPSNLIAVVGPNGCGKSNIIDAIRWVMGESSAKHLRGDSMADVIFNGSSSRKPVGQAHVELLFDNSDASLGGEYAQYSEISIKRLVTRDGHSSYFLNNTRCRRRDITGIFHGTGLGARSYSIIAQDTISRLIEAKPEEFRVYLEEAAGISKYKDRRRETENRIRHTRENLARLSDIRDELQKHLERLDRQAKAAAKYQQHRVQERLLKAQLLVLKWQAVEQELSQQQATINEQELKQEALNAEMATLVRQHTQAREQVHELTEQFETQQTHYYQVGAELARLEEAMAHQKSRRQQLVADTERVSKQLEVAQQHVRADESQYQQAQTQAEQLRPEVDSITTLLQQNEAKLKQHESDYEAWQQAWDDFNRDAAETHKTIEVEQTRVGQLQQTLSTLTEREAKLTAEQQTQDQYAQQQALAELSERRQLIDEQHKQLQATLTTAQQELQQLRLNSTDVTQALDQVRGQYQEHRGRRASLEALQQAALGKGEAAVNQWLERQHLAAAKRFAELITVSPGWERAVEIALSHSLQAICIDDLAQLTSAVDTFPAATLKFIQTAPLIALAGDALGLQPLASVAQVATGYEGLLQNLFICENSDTAFAALPNLQPQQGIITKQGLLLTRESLTVTNEQDVQAGVITRQQEIAELEGDLTRCKTQVSDLEHALMQAKAQIQDAEEAIQTHQQALAEVAKQQAEQASQQRVIAAEIQQKQAQQVRLGQELNELQQRFQHAQQQLEHAQLVLVDAQAKLTPFTEQQAELLRRKLALQQHIEALRNTITQQRQQAQQQLMRWQTANTQIESLTASLARQTESMQQLQTQHDSLVLALNSLANPEELNQQLEQKLNQHNALDDKVSVMRDKRHQAETKLQALEKSKAECADMSQALSDGVQQVRMVAEGLRVRASTFEEQLIETQHTLTEVKAELPAEANLTEWEAECERIGNKISRLGPINLAAIDEYATESERKQYLDQQNDDLVEALTTLENVIQKIDTETRSRFKETFDAVNQTFQQLFPRLFGGGKAYLELIGDNILDCGVSVMARPPGKRNSSIHLLSGGEKAMTAVALVFSIFKLNPSPFCLLDEVDAPLDDANVERFTQLVKEMSVQTQFIIITHNKVTMELAEHLTGVTMYEPGVSRLVAVDVEEAITMAEA
jgi:chromosome segregation protein